MTRLATPICTAARPMPSAAYMESVMSAIRVRISASTLATLVETAFRRGSGAVRMGRMAISLQIGERAPRVKKHGFCGHYPQHCRGGGGGNFGLRPNPAKSGG